MSCGCKKDQGESSGGCCSAPGRGRGARQKALEHHHDASGCGCCHEEPLSPERLRRAVWRLAGALILLGVGYALQRYVESHQALIIYLIAYLLAGTPVVWLAVCNIARGKIFDENFLMVVASIGAFAIGDRPEAVAVMVFYGIGELMQNLAVNRSRKSIAQLMDLRPEHARVIRKGVCVMVPPEEVQVGESIMIKPGEMVPLDGVVKSGRSFLDTRTLTGEAMLQEAYSGHEVMSGTLNIDGRLEIVVSKVYRDSTVARIMELVEHAGQRKTRSEKFITRFAAIYTPLVVGIAALVAVIPPLLAGGEWHEWIYRALCFLIISCPCALVLSIPLSFFGGIGGAARHGVLVKGGAQLEMLTQLGAVIFDKTGTLTQGKFKVDEILPAPGFTREELLKLAVSVESQSNHPAGKAIVKAYRGKIPAVDQVEEIAGMGISAVSNKHHIYAGNSELMRRIGIEQTTTTRQTVVHVACDKEYVGCITIADALKRNAAEALEQLRHNKVEYLAMFTGDTPEAAAKVASKLHLDDYKAGLLPQDKVGELEALLAKRPGGRKVAFVGDGINDAPVLMRADLGIAMGGIGSDAAIEAADVVLMSDDLTLISTGMAIARKTRSIVLQNVILALGCKGAVMILAAFGEMSVWLAIFADVGVALLALGNTMRALHYKSKANGDSKLPVTKNSKA